MRRTVAGLVIGLIVGVLTALLIRVVQPSCENGSAGTCVKPPGGAGLYVGLGAVSAGIGAACGAAWHHEQLRRRQ